MVVALLTWGAVNTPIEVIAPALTPQVTAGLLVFDTTAENCWLAPGASVMLAGETWTVTAFVTGAVVTMIESSLAPSVLPERSFTATVKAYVPALFGIPEMEPVLVPMESPGGSWPAMAEK